MPRPGPCRRVCVEPLELRQLLATVFFQQDLVADDAGAAARADPRLVNPWGLAVGARGIYVANARSGYATAYDGNGNNVGASVRVPGPNGGKGSPTGVVVNDDATKFFLPGTATPANVIFVTEEGTIDAWNTANRNRTVVVVSDRSADGYSYKGATIARFKRSPYLYVANFTAQRVDVYNASFARVNLPGRFVDPNLPRGYAPFNVQQIDNELFVMYAKRSGREEVPGRAVGLVNVFGSDGKLIRRFASGKTLNAPWGIAVAPADWGDFAGDILVGNFGDGRITAFDRATGASQGLLEDFTGQPIQLAGLWGLAFGNGKAGNLKSGLYFAAGVDHETGGLYGRVVVDTVYST